MDSGSVGMDPDAHFHESWGPGAHKPLEALPVEGAGMNATHLDRCIEAFCAQKTASLHQVVDAIEESAGSKARSASKASACLPPKPQSPASSPTCSSTSSVRGVMVPSIVIPTVLLNGEPAGIDNVAKLAATETAEEHEDDECHLNFDDLLVSVSSQLDRHLKRLQAAHHEEVRQASGFEECPKMWTSGATNWMPTGETSLPSVWGTTLKVPTAGGFWQKEGSDGTSGSPLSRRKSDRRPTDSLRSEYARSRTTSFAAKLMWKNTDGTDFLEMEMKVQRMFEEMDEDCSGNVSAKEFLSLLRSYGVDSVTSEAIEETFRSFTYATLGEESKTLSLDTFRELLANDGLDLYALCGPDVAAKITEMRTAIAQCNMSKMILRAAGVEKDHGIGVAPEETTFAMVIETFVGVVIVMNALTMGIAEDVPWRGWAIVNAVFTFFFVLEIIVKMLYLGVKKYLCGSDLLWNWADIIIASIAFVDVLIFTLLDVTNAGGLRDLTLLRLLRLIRLTRLIKLLRLKIFKELKLMLRGVFFGLRTLCWALLLFTAVLYFLALMIRLMMAPADGESPSAVPYCNPNDAFCERSQEMLSSHYQELFADTPRCIITIMRCFTDGCASVDGTPLIPTLFNIYGYALLIPYVFFMFFITFGLFNLITAILVENTVEAAKSDKARGLNLRRAEQFRIASKLKVFIDRTRYLCRQSQNGSYNGSRTSSLGVRESWKQSLNGWLLNVGLVKPEGALDSLMDNMTEVSITSEMFSDLIWDPEISEVLDDLDISASNREGLFDVLDADGSGSVTAEELVTGLLKLRGSAEKSDVVGVLLGLRVLQKDLKGQLKPMIRLLGALGQDTVQRVSRLEGMVGRLTVEVTGRPLVPEISRDPSDAVRAMSRHATSFCLRKDERRSTRGSSLGSGDDLGGSFPAGDSAG